MSQEAHRASRARSSRSLRSMNTQGDQQISPQQQPHRNPIARGVRNLFLRVSISLSSASQKLKALADEALSSDEVTNELFLATSSSSISSSLLERELSIDAEETSTTTALNANMPSDNVDTTDTKASSIVAWQDFDAVHEVETLKAELHDGEPFVEGYKVWERRRQVWTHCTRDDTLRVKQRAVENALMVPRENYPVVYTNLVEKNKTLKKPMNLKDALKVINAGWAHTRKWERAAAGAP